MHKGSPGEINGGGRERETQAAEVVGLMPPFESSPDIKPFDPDQYNQCIFNVNIMILVVRLSCWLSSRSSGDLPLLEKTGLKM